VQLLGDFLGRLSRPFQMVHWVAAGFVLQQFCDSFDYFGRFFSTDLRPPPSLRIRSRRT
jgi:hypothetical protein